MRRITNIFCLLSIIMMLNAAPAKRDIIVVNQPDGSVLTLYNHGDEFFHYLTDTDGRWVEEQPNGEYKYIDSIPQSHQNAIRAQRRAQQQTHTAYPLNISERGLIILVNFTDCAFQPENTDLDEMFNGEDYTYHGATGSARKYYNDQSMGKYNPHFDIVGPVDLPQNIAFYGKNTRTGAESSAHYMVRDACLAVDTLYDIDFSEYDNNNDNIVDFVFILYAGHNEAEGASSNTIWPHAWSLLDAGMNFRVDDVLIGNYACTSELRNNTGTERAGVGTFCHEFSHVLGLPDLYITDGSSNHRTNGAWDIMDYGLYNNNGRTPCAYSAYERFFLGWTNPTLLNQPANYTLKELQQSNACAVITQNGKFNLIGNDPDTTTFYIIENRQQTLWDAYLPGHGLMITKIQYDYNAWAGNYVNNYPTQMGVDMIEAGGNKSTKYDYPEDLFPAGANRYIPYTFYPILNIEERSDSSIHFQFMSGGEEITINDSIKTAVSSHMSQRLFSINNQQLSIAPEYDGNIILLNMSGQIIYSGNTHQHTLQHGIYLLLIEDKRYKIII